MDRISSPQQPAAPPSCAAKPAHRPSDNSPTPHTPEQIANRQLPSVVPAGPHRAAQPSWLHDHWQPNKDVRAAEQASALLDAVHDDRKALHAGYFPLHADKKFQTAWEAFAEQRERVIAEALDAKQRPTTYLPRSCAALPDDTPASNFLSAVLKANPSAPGLIIGEAHQHATPKQLLIHALPSLEALKITTLYLEQLPGDALQPALDACTAGKPVPPQLQKHLRYLDRGHKTQPGHGFTDLVTAVADFNGNAPPESRLRLIAIDTMATYFLQGTAGACRTTILNLAAESTIARAHHTPNNRFIAFTGNSHTDLWNGEVGLGPRLGVPTAHVMDCAPADAFCGQHGGIDVWPGLPGSASGTLRADYLLKAPVPSSSGQYRLQEGPTGMWLTHVTRGRALMHTPVVRERQGYRLEVSDKHSPAWADLRHRHFESLDALRDALPRGMTPVDSGLAAPPSP